MTVRPPRSKFVSALEKRLGRSLSDQEMLRLASCARALKVRKAQQQRVYKPRMELWDDGDSPLVTAVFEVPGLRPADVSVDVVDGRLVVSGERRQPEQGFSTSPKTSPPGNGNGNGNGTHCSEPTEPGTVCVRASEETLAHAGTVTVLQVRELKYGFFRRVVAVPAGCTTAHLQATMFGTSRGALCQNGCLLSARPDVEGCSDARDLPCILNPASRARPKSAPNPPLPSALASWDIPLPRARSGAARRVRSLRRAQSRGTFGLAPILPFLGLAKPSSCPPVAGEFLP